MHIGEHGGQHGAGDDDTPLIAARNARTGMWLFALYGPLYAAFVLISAFRPDWMAQRPFLGINLAIWYGFGLLGGALLLALVYSWLCRAREAT
jgi:uncharacterized membrane protein (DUF485 family)